MYESGDFIGLAGNVIGYGCGRIRNKAYGNGIEFFDGLAFLANRFEYE